MNSLSRLLQDKYTKAVGLYTIGNIFNRAISLLLLPIFTKLLSTNSYGIVSTYNSWVSIATVLVSLQLDMTLRSAWNDKRKELDGYISSMMTLTIVASVAMLLVCVSLSPLLFKNLPLILVLFCIIQSFCQSVVNMEIQKEMMALQYVKRTLLLSLPNLIAAILGIITLMVYPDSQYLGRIVPCICTYLVISSVLLHIFYKRGRTIVNRGYWHYGLAYSLPLVFHGLANTVLSGFDFSMITAYRSASETGIYSVAYTLGMAVGVFTGSLESVWIPWFTEHMNNGGKETINKAALIYIYIASLLCICVMFCLPEVLMLFTDKSYWSGVTLIPPVVLASYIIFMYSLSVDVEYYYRSTKMIALNTIVAACVNVVLNFIFIPKYGAYAAAWTTVISYFVSFVIHYICARRIDRDLFELKLYILPFLLVFASVFVSGILEWWLIRWGIAATLMMIMGIYYYKNNGLFYKKNQEKI